jgi:TRAP-type C4-dicarboxylate transport system permease small subunit
MADEHRDAPIETSMPAKLVDTGRKLFFNLCGLTLIVFTGLVLYSVIMRYFFNSPPIWGEDVPKLLFVWLTFIGAAFAGMLGMNIRVTYLVDKMRPDIRRRVEIAMHAIVCCLLVLILWYSIPILQLTSRGTMLSTGWSNALTYLALPTGAALTLVHQIWRIVKLARGGADDPVGDESTSGF